MYLADDFAYTFNNKVHSLDVVPCLHEHNYWKIFFRQSKFVSDA